MVNNVVLVGRLTADPELRYIPSSGTAVANFTLAVDRPYSNQQGETETDFIRINVWRKQAENCANYLQKGSMAAVEGTLQIRKYDDKEGIRRISPEVVGYRVKFLDTKRSQGGQGNSDWDGAEAPPPAGSDVNENDIPF